MQSLFDNMKTGIAEMNNGLWATEADFDTDIKSVPRFTEGWSNRATGRYLQGNYGASIADRGRLLNLEPRHFDAMSGFGVVRTPLG